MDLLDGRILIVDDQENNCRVLDRMLRRAGYSQIKTTTDPRAVLPLFTTFKPDLVLLDLHMPHLDGFAILHELAPYLPDAGYLPILVLTADITPESKQKALSIGAKDFLSKPFDRAEVLLRIKNLLEGRFLYLALQNQNQVLEEKVRVRTRELEESEIEILERLAVAAEFRDDDTREHTKRVGRTSALLARGMGMTDTHVELIRRAAPLHDIGKIAIPDHILLKLGRLTPEEFAVIRTHTTIGARILSGSRFPLLQLAEQIALTHHEHWDGGGYGAGLRGESIPLAGRIVAVADVFDALVHARPYKPAWPVEDAKAEIERAGGRQFDPRVVDVFLSVAERHTVTEPKAV